MEIPILPSRAMAMLLLRLRQNGALGDRQTWKRESSAVLSHCLSHAPSPKQSRLKPIRSLVELRRMLGSESNDRGWYDS
jgi:hypothetical protein